MRTKIVYVEGFYEITPMGPQTTFECILVPKWQDEFVLIDPKTYQDLTVNYDLLSRMRPQFIRKYEPKALA